MAVLEFAYDNSTKAITATNDSIISFSLYGGGGGGGGNDSHAGSYGVSGGTIHGSMLLKKDQTIYCTVGDGGSPGVSGRGGAAGGSAKGFARDGFSGGAGGRAGWSGSSGGGGQGGGATVLSWSPTGNSDLIAVAAGGGGGGGGGNVGAANGTIVSYTPYGDIVPFLYKRYPTAADNGAYCAFLNTYGVWAGDGRYVYDVYFPSSGTYTFRLSADNYAYMWLDNGTVHGNNDFIGNTPGTGRADFDRYYDFSHYVTAGWHTVDVYASNWGGPAAVAAAIMPPQSSSYMWTTLESYNKNSTVYKGRGGHGTDKAGDGGGAGGGGGGWPAGRGGDLRSGDQGAYSGSSGYSWWDSNVVTITNVPISSPAGITYGTGGANTANGVGGGAIFDITLSEINSKSGGQWKKVNGLYRRESLNLLFFRWVYWTEVNELNVKKDGVWKKVYGKHSASWNSQQVGQCTNTSGPYPTL